jgi:hypothetical protein
MRFTLVSALSFALLLSLAATPAHAAKQACKEGAKATISGEILSVSFGDDRDWMWVNDESWDCHNIFIVVKKGQAPSCGLRAFAHATGTLTKRDPDNLGFYGLVDPPSGKGPRLTGTVSCSSAAKNKGK